MDAPTDDVLRVRGWNDILPATISVYGLTFTFLQLSGFPPLPLPHPERHLSQFTKKQSTPFQKPLGEQLVELSLWLPSTNLEVPLRLPRLFVLQPLVVRLDL